MLPALSRRNGFLSRENTFDRLFDGMLSEKRIVSPRVHLTESDDSFHLEAEVPGIRLDDISLSYEKGILTLTATRSEEENSQGKVLYSDRQSMSYSRSFRLDIDVDKAEAKLENGILKVQLPKSEILKPKKICISGG